MPATPELPPAEAGPAGFRPDIEGLRALAIVPILLLHCGVSWLRGGYVGVDVFFVISGYLITGILKREMALGRFSPARFYARRAWRILPALGVTLAVTGLAGVWLLLPSELADLGGSMLASAGFLANVYFDRHVDYFAQSADTMPLIHLWSLAVEEQFYLLFPPVLYAIVVVWRRDARWPLAGLLALSLAMGAGMVWFAPQSAYYLLPARGWELLAGALLALGAMPDLARHRHRDLLGGGALGLLGLSFLLIKSSLPFPVPFALFPVGATCAIIALGGTGMAGRLLALPALRYIGRISFSLYLVHRPLIAFYELTHGARRQGGDVALLVLGSLLLAMALHHGVERPLLERGKRLPARHGLVFGGAGLAAMALIALAPVPLAAQWHPLPPRAAFAAGFMGYNNTARGKAQFDTDGCFVLPTSPPGTGQGCLASDPRRDNILLLGDSHAAQFSRALRDYVPGTHLIQATAAGCRPLLHGKGLNRCRAIFRQATGREDWSRISTVILAGRWLPEEIDDVAATARYLAGKGPRVIVVGPMVEYDIDLPRLAALAIARGEADLPSRYLLTDRLALDAVLARKIAATPAGYFSPLSRECPQGRCRLFAPDGSPFHFDHSHLTYGASRDMVSALMRSRGAATAAHRAHDIL